MKYDLITPCQMCPFRSDVEPFIRAARAREILAGNGDFPCHKTVDYEKNGGDSRVRGDDEQHCAGVLIILEKEERPHQMMRIAERLGMYDRSKLRMDAPVYDGIAAAIIAHNRAERNGRC